MFAPWAVCFPPATPLSATSHRTPSSHRGDCGDEVLVLKNPPASGRRLKFDPRVRKIPWTREWQPTPVILPEEFQGQRSLMGYSPWRHKESGRREANCHTRMLSQELQTSRTALLPPRTCGEASWHKGSWWVRGSLSCPTLFPPPWN